MSDAQSASERQKSTATDRLSRFIARLLKSGLVTEDDLQHCRESMPAAERDREESLARALAKYGYLTRWQVEKVWKGKTSGFLVSQYRILEQLGEGGMGKVYRARHTFMDREVALKILPPRHVENPQSAARFLREVRTNARLTHPNIVTVHDAGQFGRIVYMTMELVEGQNLEDYIDQHGPMPLRMAAEVIAQAAEGLLYAHERGIIHRDIKPPNLMVSNAGQVKILDLGVVRYLGADTEDIGSDRKLPQDSRLTADGMLCGTVAYIAPEQIRDPRKVDFRSDIYSLGCTYYFLLTGQHAFRAETPYRVMEMKVSTQPTPLRELRPDAPAEMAAIVEKMMARSPDDRYASGTEVIAALAPYREPVLSPQARYVADDDNMAWLHGTQLASDDNEEDLAWLVSGENSLSTRTGGVTPADPLRRPPSLPVVAKASEPTPPPPDPDTGSFREKFLRLPLFLRIAIVTTIFLTVSLILILLAGRRQTVEPTELVEPKVALSSAVLPSRHRAPML